MMVVDVRDMPPEQWRLGVETRMLVSARNGAAHLCIFEQWIAPGAGAPTHSHPVEEVLTVREGEAEMWLGGERGIVTSGQSLIVPAGQLHGFRNSGTDHAAHPRRTGVANLRGHGGGRNGSDAAVGPGLSERRCPKRSRHRRLLRLRCRLSSPSGWLPKAD